jgi:hypothetical protein
MLDDGLRYLEEYHLSSYVLCYAISSLKCCNETVVNDLCFLEIGW